jgi:hypothetical protein
LARLVRVIAIIEPDAQHLLGLDDRCAVAKRFSNDITETSVLHQATNLVDSILAPEISVDTDITTTLVRCALTDEEAAALPAPEGTLVLHPDTAHDEGPSLTARFGRLFGREHWKELE